MCHETCEENGSIIESAAGWAGKCVIMRANGALLRSSINEGVTIESVRDNWDQIIDIKNAKKFNSIGEASGALVTSLEGLRTGEASETPGDVFEFTNKETILYALGGNTCIQLYAYFITHLKSDFYFVL